MTRVDFYVLPSHDPHTRRVMACRLIEKAFRQGHTVYLKTDSPDEVNLFDDLLWTFRQGSFLPHERVDTLPREAPIILGHVVPPSDMKDVLVNLGVDMPEGFTAFDRVAELIDQDEAVKAAGRQRYRAYQAHGFTPETHQLERVDT